MQEEADCHYDQKGGRNDKADEWYIKFELDRSVFDDSIEDEISINPIKSGNKEILNHDFGLFEQISWECIGFVEEIKSNFEDFDGGQGD